MKKRLLSFLLAAAMVCCLLPATAFASATHEVDNKDTFVAAIAAAADGDTIKIAVEELLLEGEGVTIDGKSLILELNGNTVKLTSTGTVDPEANICAITLINGASLTVRDSSPEHEGKIEESCSGHMQRGRRHAAH